MQEPDLSEARIRKLRRQSFFGSPKAQGELMREVALAERTRPTPGPALIYGLWVWIADERGHRVPGILQALRGDKSTHIRPAEATDDLRLVTNVRGKISKVKYQGQLAWLAEYAGIPELAQALAPFRHAISADMRKRILDRKLGVVELFKVPLGTIRPVRNTTTPYRTIVFEANGRRWLLVARNPREMMELGSIFGALTDFQSGGQESADVMRREETARGEAAMEVAVEEWHERVPQLFAVRAGGPDRCRECANTSLSTLWNVKLSSRSAWCDGRVWQV